MDIIKRFIGFIIRGITKLTFIIILYFLIFGANVLFVLVFNIESVDAMSEQNRNLYFALPALFGGLYIGRRLYSRFSLAIKINNLLGIPASDTEPKQ